MVETKPTGITTTAAAPLADSSLSGSPMSGPSHGTEGGPLRLW